MDEVSFFEIIDTDLGKGFDNSSLQQVRYELN
jgi:hypothetical protein